MVLNSLYTAVIFPDHSLLAWLLSQAGSLSVQRPPALRPRQHQRADNQEPAADQPLRLGDQQQGLQPHQAVARCRQNWVSVLLQL